MKTIDDLTLNDAIRIRVKIRCGEWTKTQAAEEYDVVPETISQIMRRESHNHGIAQQIRNRRRIDANIAAREQRSPERRGKG